MWELARICERFQSLPCDGGAAEQPYGALVTMRTLLDYAHDYAVYNADSGNAPLEVRRRVLKVMAAAHREDN